MNFPRLASLLLACAMTVHPARAQIHEPSDDAEYATALADPTLTHIKIKNHITLPSADYSQTSTNAITFESADEGQYTLVGGGEFSNYRGYSTSGDLDALHNLKFSDFFSGANLGGAIHIGGSVHTGISATVFENNWISGGTPRGGGFFVGGNFSGDISNNTRFEGNGSGDGGGFYVDGDFAGDIGDTTFESNESWVDGGGFYVDGDFTGDIRDTVFESNTAGQDGGGFYMGGGDFIGNIRDTTFKDNTAGQAGGGFALGNFTGDIRDTVFENNTANDDGGGFYVSNFTGDLTNVTFSGNKVTASPSGGGGFSVNDFDGTITGTTFQNNQAVEGGGFFANMDAGGIVDSRFFDNKAEWSGGAINVTNVQTIQNSRLIGNQANNPANAVEIGGMGGAVFLNGDGSLSDTLFLHNQAATLALDDTVAGGRGGAIFHNVGISSTLDIAASVGKRTLFYGNTGAQAASGSNETPNAIHFAHIFNCGLCDANLTVQADGTGSRVLMLDLSSQGDDQVDGFGNNYGNVRVYVTKTGTGDWVLGGVTNIAGEGG